MANEFRCKQCDRLLQAGDAKPGTRMLCPACGAFSTVPSPDTGSPIEFRCTQCRKLLRTPGDTAGKQAQCPECGAVLTVPTAAARPLEETRPGEGSPFGSVPPPPTPGPGAGSPFAPGAPEPITPVDPGDAYQAPRQYAPPQQAYRYSDPLVANRVSAPAIALIITAAIGLGVQVLCLPINLLQIAGGAAARQPMNLPFVFDPRFAVVSGVIAILFGIIVLIGALKMKNLESYGFAVASAIIAMVPCTSPCCVLGLPFGIWALVVLCDSQVRAAFRS